MVASQNPERDAYIAGLREIADWLEQNPDAAFPRYSTDINVPLMDNAKVEEFASAVGAEIGFDENGNASADIKFGSIVYHAYGYADWDRHIADRSESQARTWADENDMVIQPREGGDES